MVGDFASVFHSDNPDLPCLDSDDLNVTLPEKCSTKRLFWDCDLCILTLEGMIHSLLGAVSLSTIGPSGWPAFRPFGLVISFLWARICPDFPLRLRRPSIEYHTSRISLIFLSSSTSPPLHPTAKIPRNKYCYHWFITRHGWASFVSPGFVVDPWQPAWTFAQCLAPRLSRRGQDYSVDPGILCAAWEGVAQALLMDLEIWGHGIMLV